jgi:hypothetical protein
MATKAVQCLAVRKAGHAWMADPRRFTVKADSTTDMIDLREIIKEKACKEHLMKVDEGLELWLVNRMVLESGVMLIVLTAERTYRNRHRPCSKSNKSL